jgi:hypothetical protein
MAEQPFLCVFAYADIMPSTMDCLLRDLPSLGPVVYHRESLDALISRARSTAASIFLRSECDVLVMIDHDLGWQPGDLQRLIAGARHTRGVVGGLYPKRTFGKGFASRILEEGAHAIPSNVLVEAEYVSTGFFAVHREVVEGVAATMPLTNGDFWPLFLPMLSPPRADGRPEYLSEDWAFCERARNLGFPLYLDLAPVLTHTGRHTYRLIDSVVPLPDDLPVTIEVRR